MEKRPSEIYNGLSKDKKDALVGVLFDDYVAHKGIIKDSIGVIFLVSVILLISGIITENMTMFIMACSMVILPVFILVRSIQYNHSIGGSMFRKQ